MKEEIVTLYGEDGSEIDFYIDAEIELEDECYMVLRPVSTNLGLNSDEALVFRVDYIDGESNFELVEDDDLLKIISDKYNEA